MDLNFCPEDIDDKKRTHDNKLYFVKNIKIR